MVTKAIQLHDWLVFSCFQERFQTASAPGCLAPKYSGNDAVCTGVAALTHVSLTDSLERCKSVIMDVPSHSECFNYNLPEGIIAIHWCLFPHGVSNTMTITEINCAARLQLKWHKHFPWELFLDGLGAPGIARSRCWGSGAFACTTACAESRDILFKASDASRQSCEPQLQLKGWVLFRASEASSWVTV